MPRMIDAEKLHLKLLDMEFPIQDQDPILDAMDDCEVDPPHNDPMTLEELREMDGEPVWLEREQSAYYDVLHISKSGDSCCFYTTQLYTADYGKTWLAYRRKPEEGP